MSYFDFKGRSTTIGKEVRAGATTFMAMAYIIFANPAILQAAGVPFNGAVVATCVTAGIMCILMGVLTNYPMCMAAGMGLNAMVAFTICKGMGYTWQTAMGVVVLEGLAVLALSATAFRAAVLDAIPASLKHAIAGGVGLFITFIGLQGGNFIKSHPATLVTFEEFSNPVTLLSGISLLITALLLTRGARGALLIGIVATAVLGMLPVWHLPAGYGSPAAPAPHLSIARWGALIPWPSAVLDLPRDWSTFFQADVRGAFIWKLVPVAFAFMMTDFFDSMGTAVAVGARAGYLDAAGRIPKLRSLLLVDSLGAVAGGAFGCSSNTCYIESAAGAAEGGRTGLTAITCGLLFLLSLFVVPLVSVVGGGVQIAPGVVRYPVTSAVLILVGLLMIESILAIKWHDLTEAIPAFLVVVITPLTFSISHGIGAGFITYVVLMSLSGRGSEVRAILWLVAAMFLVVLGLPAFT